VITAMELTRRRFLLAAAAAAGAAAAPAAWALLPRPVAQIGPPILRYGRDRCDFCGMIISDPRYAAAARQGPEVWRYDDIGCMLAHAGPAIAEGKAAGFARDAGTEQWLGARVAVYVRSASVQTPMGSGIVAFADAGAARTAHPQAPVVGFDALLTGHSGEHR
jgi:copper chaperone NosL